MDSPPHLSLLWPPGSSPQAATGARLDAQALADLDLSETIHALGGQDSRRERFVRDVLSAPYAGPAVIVYRADALDDLLADAALRAALRDLLPRLESLTETYRPRSSGSPLTHLARRLSALEMFVEVALELQDVLAGVTRRADALDSIHASLRDLTARPEFAALRAELPGLRQQLAGVRSVTVGVNLSPDLEPETAALLALHPEPIAGHATLLARLLGRRGGEGGLTPLRGSDLSPDNRLLRDLRGLLDRVVAPVERALERFATISPGLLAGLAPELALLLGAADLTLRLREADLPVCRPSPAPDEERACTVEEGYHLSLALRLLDRRRASPDDAPPVVTNDMVFDDRQGRVWILTGPNRGGKTTYTRAVGQIHVLAQAGLPVPARSARLSPVDGVYTHFPSRESATPGRGRLDDEAAGLAAIFARATPRSLILLNEVLAGTSTVEALDLAIDVVRGLRLLGARAVYVTHLHELAQQVDELNARTEGAALVGSLVAEAAPNLDPNAEAAPDGTDRPAHRRTFRVHPGPPRGSSYASDIAAQHGISYPQLARLLQERGILPPGM